jgi:hypothetical protein
MSDATIFGDGNTPPVAPVVPVQPNSFEDLLGSIKNERGEPKYADVATALAALKASQDYIPQVKTELQKAQESLAAKDAEIIRLKAIEDTVAQLTSQPAASSQPASAAPKEADVAALVEQIINQRDGAKTAEANQKLVVKTIRDKFGADAEKVFYGKAEELGLSIAEINALAAKNPNAVLKLIGVDQGQPQVNRGFTPPASSLNTEGYQPQKESHLARNEKSVLFGATTGDVINEHRAAGALVEELASQGLSVHDLTDPKVFSRYFK